MQGNLAISSGSRVVSSDTNWRGDGRAASAVTPQPNAAVSDKSQAVQARKEANHQPKPKAPLNDPLQSAAPASNSPDEASADEQAAWVYAAAGNSRGQTPITADEKRRNDAASRRIPASYSLASYTGERANRVYLELATRQTGKMLDEVV